MAMQLPAWFNESHYLISKLAQLRALEPHEPRWQQADPAALAELSNVLIAHGYTPLTHFQLHGQYEGVSHNTWFDTYYYLQDKVRQLNEVQEGGRSDWTLGQLQETLWSAGLSAWEHYQQNGWQEGVNPSSAFPVTQYLSNKLQQLQTHFAHEGWTMPGLVQALKDAQLDPLSHYLQFGQHEGVSVTETAHPPSSPPSTLESFAQQKSSINAAVGTTATPTDSHLASLISSDVWKTNILTYSFNEHIPTSYWRDSKQTDGWRPLNDTEKWYVQSAIQSLAELVAIRFDQVAGSQGDIRFNAVTMRGSTNGFASYPGQDVGGDVFLSNQETYGAGKYALQALIHELGHAMGLNHPFESTPRLSTEFDNTAWTVMSYTNQRIQTIDFSIGNQVISSQWQSHASKATFSVLDVQALHAMYGANLSTRVGNDVYTLDPTRGEHLTIWDAGGQDLIDVSQLRGDSLINLNSGTLSSAGKMTVEDIFSFSLEKLVNEGHAVSQYFQNWMRTTIQDNYHRIYNGENNLSIVKGAIIENVKTGAGNDFIVDNAVDNVIETGTGNDIISLGRGGYDYVNGGDGFDVVTLDITKHELAFEKQADHNYLIVGEHFAAQLVGVEQINFLHGDTLLL